MNEYDNFMKCIFKHQSQITTNEQCQYYSSHEKLNRTISLGTPCSSLNFQCYLSIWYSRHHKLSKKIVKYSYGGGAWGAYLAHGLLRKINESFIRQDYNYMYYCSGKKWQKIANIFMFLKIYSPWEGLTREYCCHSGVGQPVPLHHAVNRYQPLGLKAVISPLHWLLMSWNCLDRSAGGVTGAFNHKQMSLF